MNFKSLLILTNMPSPHQVDLFNELAKRFDIKVIYAKKSESNRKWNYESYIKHDHIILNGPINKKIKTLKKHLNENKLFIISGYNLPEFIYSMAYLSAKNKPWLFWGERMRMGKLWIKNITIFKLLRHTKGILGIGELAARLYYEMTDVPSFVFPYHINTSSFDKKNSSFSNGKINFLYSGQLIRRKGIIEMLKAFELVKKEYKDRVLLHIVGDGPLMKTVKDRISDYSHLVELYGFVKYENLPEIYQKGDIFLFPSLYDGWGVALTEGMAAGMVPISTFTTTAATDLILHGYNGFIVPPGNHVELARYMKLLIEKPDKIKTMGKRASNYVREYLDIKKGAEKLFEIVSQIK